MRFQQYIQNALVYDKYSIRVPLHHAFLFDIQLKKELKFQTVSKTGKVQSTLKSAVPFFFLNTMNTILNSHNSKSSVHAFIESSIPGPFFQ